MSKKIILYPLIVSIICHYIFLYSDRIYNNLFLALNNLEKKELSIIDKNIEKLQMIKKNRGGILSGSVGSKNISDLIEHFQDEKEKYLSKVVEKRKNKKEGKTDNIGVGLATVDQQFGKFSGKSSVLQKEVASIQLDKSFNVSIVSRSSYLEKPKCEASYYGIGMVLGLDYTITKISENSNVAKKINIKIGDYLLGFKNSDNKFYEGNSLIPLIQKSYKNETLTVILKQDGKIVENQIVLDTICYERNKANIQ